MKCWLFLLFCLVKCVLLLDRKVWNLKNCKTDQYFSHICCCIPTRVGIDSALLVKYILQRWCCGAPTLLCTRRLSMDCWFINLMNFELYSLILIISYSYCFGLWQSLCFLRISCQIVYKQYWEKGHSLFPCLFYTDLSIPFRWGVLSDAKYVECGAGLQLFPHTHTCWNLKQLGVVV